MRSPDENPTRLQGYWSSPPRRALSIIGGVFLLHLIFRWDVLTLPIWWDSPVGPFLQGHWLMNHGFDWVELMDQKRYYVGPNVYPSSALPLLYGLVMKLSPQPVVGIVALHLLNFLLAGLMAWILYEIFQRLVQLPVWCALAAAVAVLLHPTFGSQVDLITMELPAAAATLAAAWMLMRKRWLAASLLATLAVFVKESAVIIAVTGVCVGWLNLAVDSGAWRTRVRHAACLLLPFTPLLINLAAEQTDHRFLFHPMGTVGVFSIIESIPVYPVVYLGTLAMFAALPLLLWRGGLFRALREHGPIGGLRQALAVDTNQVCLVAMVAVLGYLAIGCLGAFVLHRYIVWYLAMFWVTTIVGFRILGLSKESTGIVIVAACVFFLTNQHGRWMPPLSDYYSRAGDHRERSREIVEDIRLLEEATAWLDANAGDRLIICNGPLPRILAIPEFGYVSRPLNVASVAKLEMEYPPIPARDVSLSDEQQRDAWYLQMDIGFEVPAPELPDGYRQEVLWQKSTESKPGSPIRVVAARYEPPAPPNSVAAPPEPAP